MRKVACPSCGGETRRFGKTAAGAQRWRCPGCGLASVGRIDNSAKRLDELLGWPLSKGRQSDMAGGGGPFGGARGSSGTSGRSRPSPGEVCRVVFVDGICLSRKAPALMAGSEGSVPGRYVAGGESSAAYRALMARIAPPEVVVTDGGSGFRKAGRQAWPGTRARGCAFHASGQARRHTTTRPRTQAGPTPTPSRGAS